MAGSINFNCALTPDICQAVIIFISERLQISDGGESRFVYETGLHADQFRNKVYSYGANLFFTRHKPNTSLFHTLAFFSQV